MNTTMVKGLFIIAAIYDGVLGLLFLFAPGLAFEVFEVVPPNHFGYVQFPAILLLIFAAMFYRVAMDPVASRFIMLYGVVLKAGYSVSQTCWAVTGLCALCALVGMATELAGVPEYIRFYAYVAFGVVYLSVMRRVWHRLTSSRNLSEARRRPKRAHDGDGTSASKRVKP